MRRIFLLAVLSVLPLAGGADEERARIKEQELAEVRERIAELTEKIERQTRRRDELGAELGAVEAAIGSARVRLEKIETEVRESRARLDDIARQQARRRGELGAEKERLAGQLRAAYTSGRQERIKLLLNQEEPAQLGRLLAYYGYLNRVRGENIRQVRDQLEALAALRRQETAEQERVAELAAEQRAELDRLAASRRERERLVAAIEAEIAGRGDEVARLRRQEEDLTRLIAELSSILGDYPITSEEPFDRLKGRLTWPVAGRLIQDYGQPRGNGRLRWNGVLIAAPAGREVRAVYHGRIAYADWLPGLGLLVVVDHGDGYLSLYGHNESLLKSAGDWVAPGDALATVGQSGGQAVAALYFEIRKGRKPVDPGDWVTRRPGGG
ncbi:MAG TPA: peptidoglycan DD-metalloendopeptidase family protein [Woeseiaceae bacterium]|nr:peptidoglycan DD-metalloendopeptidase family protein [Woeseiaceae bacterium]